MISAAKPPLLPTCSTEPHERSEPAHHLRASLVNIVATERSLDAAKSDAQTMRDAAERAKAARMSASEAAGRERKDREIWEATAQEADLRLTQTSAEIDRARRQAEGPNAPAPRTFGEIAKDTAQLIDLDEAATRALLDQQLRDTGWEANFRNASLRRRRAAATGTKSGDC